jgi:hypothetical protein
VSQDFDDAAERARLAAADLSAAANDVIRRNSISWGSARDEVDFAELSRVGRYFPSRKLDYAQEYLEFAGRAETEIGSITASIGEAPPVGSPANATSEGESIRRLIALAVECERRAAGLRS